MVREAQQHRNGEGLNGCACRGALSQVGAYENEHDEQRGQVAGARNADSHEVVVLASHQISQVA